MTSRWYICCFIAIFVFFESCICKQERKPVSDAEATKYLTNYGYVTTSNVLLAELPGVGLDRNEGFSALKNAVRKFQEFAGLRQTGELDDATKRKMAEPRCGVADVLAVTRGRRPAFKWNKNDLTYSIESYSPDLPHDDIRHAMRQAFSMWSKVAPLNFEEVPHGGDIKIRFATRAHGDPWPFDGRGGVLAHATMPPNGMLHFDEDENWVYMDPKKIARFDYTDFLAVAIHESGHTLGLDHSRDETSIMAPFYQDTVDAHGNYKMPQLNSDDITKIQEIYGPRRGIPPRSDNDNFGPSNKPSSPSDGSDKGRKHGGGGGGFFDRIKSFFGFGSNSSSDDEESDSDSSMPSHGSNSDDLGFPSAGFFPNSDNVHSGAPNSPSVGFGECPRDVDGVTTIDGITYLFSGSKVYQINGEKVGKVYSLKQLFPNSPVYVQGALTVPQSDVTLLFQHKQVYAYSQNHSHGNFKLNPKYPKRLPSALSFDPMGAFVWADGRQFLVNARDFAVYDDYWNKQTLEGKISNYFHNFPDEPIRGVVIEGSTATFYANEQVYKYDIHKNQLIGKPIPLRTYLHC